MPQEKQNRIKGIGLVLASEAAIREIETKDKIFPSSFVRPPNFDKVMPDRGSPISEIIDPEMANWKRDCEKKKRKAKPKKGGK
ncbi:MAG: hypothetical protein WC460_05730 [Patescibacteria group bacterium]